MKKVIFMIKNMNIGGIEKSLLSLLNVIPKDKYNITLLMLEKYGGFLNYIPNTVKVIFLDRYKEIKRYVNDPPQLIALDLFKKKEYLKAILISLVYIITKLTGSMEVYYRYLLWKCPKVEGYYDIAIAFHGPMDIITYYISKKIISKKKVQWVHFDINKIGFSRKFADKLYKKFDKIFVVSEGAKNNLISLLPNLRSKTQVFYNIISYKMIIKMSEEGIGFVDNFNGIRILTVGRLCKEKGQDQSIPVLKTLRGDGYNVRWYCVGEGGSHNEYEKLIRTYGVEENYILLGARPNPYPYMKQCDIYVQTSRHEGYCITLGEARCFSKPIVSTNFTGASEQIINEQTGLIVGCNEQEIYHAVRRLLDDDKLRDTIINNLRLGSVDTTKEIEKMYEFVDSDY